MQKTKQSWLNKLFPKIVLWQKKSVGVFLRRSCGFVFRKKCGVLLSERCKC